MSHDGLIAREIYSQRKICDRKRGDFGGDAWVCRQCVEVLRVLMRIVFIIIMSADLHTSHRSLLVWWAIDHDITITVLGKLHFTIFGPGCRFVDIGADVSVIHVWVVVAEHRNGFELKDLAGA